MPRQISLSAIVDLPDDMFLAATATAALQAPWQTLLESLRASGVTHHTRCETLETRAKPATNGTGARRGRKPGARNAPATPPAETVEASA